MEFLLAGVIAALLIERFLADRSRRGERSEAGKRYDALVQRYEHAYAVCSGERDSLLDRLQGEVEAARKERGDLLQRIQAPEVATALHASDIVNSPEGLLHVPLEDFEAYQRDLQDQGVTFDA